jgi:hypothetical protein
MRHLLNVCGIATAAVALAAVMPSAVAQENTFTYACQSVGNSAPEPLGDREGHAISVAQAGCHLDSGPFAGGVLTNTTIWEWDKTNGVLVSGQNVIRKPGATAVIQFNEGKIALTVADGKVTGFTASGRSTFRLATGSAASLTGKSYTWTGKSTGPGQYTIEGKLE